MQKPDKYHRCSATAPTHFFTCKPTSESLERLKRKLHASGVSWRVQDWSEMAWSEAGRSVVIALVSMPPRVATFWATRARVVPLS